MVSAQSGFDLDWQAPGWWHARPPHRQVGPRGRVGAGGAGALHQAQGGGRPVQHLRGPRDQHEAQLPVCGAGGVQAAALRQGSQVAMMRGHGTQWPHSVALTTGRVAGAADHDGTVAELRALSWSVHPGRCTQLPAAQHTATAMGVPDTSPTLDARHHQITTNVRQPRDALVQTTYVCVRGRQQVVGVSPGCCCSRFASG